MDRWGRIGSDFSSAGAEGKRIFKGLQMTRV